MSGKNITASVGEGGANIPAEVAMVQYLLNCVPAAHGGPANELEIDGFAGVVTIQAINRFQTAQFGWADNLVEPERSGAATFRELKKYDPLPFSALVVAPNYKPEVSRLYDGYITGKKHSGVLRGKKHSGGRPATAAEIAELGRFEPSPFKPRGKALGKKHSGVL